MTLQMEYNEKYRQGLEKRIEQGIQQGEATAKEAAARRMLADGTLSMEQITDFTGLNLKQIEELKVWGHMLNFLKLQLKSAVGRKKQSIKLDLQTG